MFTIKLVESFLTRHAKGVYKTHKDYFFMSGYDHGIAVEPCTFASIDAADTILNTAREMNRLSSYIDVPPTPRITHRRIQEER